MFMSATRMNSKYELLVKLIKTACIALAAFHLYTGMTGPFQSMIQRAIHVGGGFSIFFLLSIEEKINENKNIIGIAIDGLLLIATVICCSYILLSYERIVDPFFEPTKIDVILGLCMTFIVLEVTRRMIGWFIPLLALFMVFYTLFGNYFPGVWRHSGVSLDYMAEVLYLSDRGIWGLVTGLSATVIAAFVMLGAVLFATGGGKAFIDLSCWIVGDSYGGAAKLATVASSLFGIISGSGSANVATTGAFTIPLMKRIGYKPEFAAAEIGRASCRERV